MSIMSDDDFVRLFQRTFGLTADVWVGYDHETQLREQATPASITVPAMAG